MFNKRVVFGLSASLALGAALIASPAAGADPLTFTGDAIGASTTTTYSPVAGTYARTLSSSWTARPATFDAGGFHSSIPGLSVDVAELATSIQDTTQGTRHYVTAVTVAHNVDIVVGTYTPAYLNLLNRNYLVLHADYMYSFAGVNCDNQANTSSVNNFVNLTVNGKQVLYHGSEITWGVAGYNVSVHKTPPRYVSVSGVHFSRAIALAIHKNGPAQDFLNIGDASAFVHC